MCCSFVSLFFGFKITKRLTLKLFIICFNGSGESMQCFFFLYVKIKFTEYTKKNFLCLHQFTSFLLGLKGLSGTLQSTAVGVISSFPWKIS